MSWGCLYASTPRIKVFRSKMHLIPNKDMVKCDAWTCKSFLSFVKMKTHKKLGSAVSWLKGKKQSIVWGIGAAYV